MSQGMEPGDSISLYRRKQNVDYARTLEKEISDYHQAVDKNRSKERLAYMKSALEFHDTQADIYTSLQQIRGDQIEAEIRLAADELVSWRRAITDM